MKQSKYSDEQIVSILQEAASGQKSQSQVCRESPWQNGHAESFMARLRAECLDAEDIHNLADAQLKLEVFRRSYNQERPHWARGYIPPAQFAQQLKDHSG